jgi:hypothetical protein
MPQARRPVEYSFWRAVASRASPARRQEFSGINGLIPLTAFGTYLIGFVGTSRQGPFATWR